MSCHENQPCPRTPASPSPTGAGAPPAAPVVTGAPTRSFAQSQIVPTQQPTLTLEINKGTAIKLPGAATTVFVASPDIAAAGTFAAGDPFDAVQDVLIHTVSITRYERQATFSAFPIGDYFNSVNEDDFVLDGKYEASIRLIESKYNEE